MSNLAPAANRSEPTGRLLLGWLPVRDWLAASRTRERDAHRGYDYFLNGYR